MGWVRRISVAFKTHRDHPQDLSSQAVMILQNNMRKIELGNFHPKVDLMILIIY
jgi:hypothetical protein